MATSVLYGSKLEENYLTSTYSPFIWHWLLLCFGMSNLKESEREEFRRLGNFVDSIKRLVSCLWSSMISRYFVLQYLEYVWSQQTCVTAKFSNTACTQNLRPHFEVISRFRTIQNTQLFWKSSKVDARADHIPLILWWSILISKGTT